MRQWYVVKTHSRSETKAKFHLDRQGFSTYLPQYWKKRSHARRVDWRAAPMFPSYLFVQFDPIQESWRSIHSTIGVSHIICSGEHPTSVPQSLVQEMQTREDSRGMIRIAVSQELKKGQKVRILRGPMADQIGIFACSDDRQRVLLFLELLGQQVRVNLPKEAISPVQ